MFFPERIQSIRSGDKVLEIGPGSTPFPRADAFLEFDFQDDAETIRQRGDVPATPSFGGRRVTHYRGDRFPFDDGEFDYIIASHVIEHVHDPRTFMEEVFRVGKGRGYVEFPLPPYEYLFDFDVHRHFVWIDDRRSGICYVPKTKLGLRAFDPVTAQLRRSLELGWDDVIAQNTNVFFGGFEFHTAFSVEACEDISRYKGDFDKDGRTLGRRVVRRLARALG